MEKMNCVNCSKIACLVGAKRRPEACPMEKYPEIYENGRQLFQSEEVKRIAKAAGIVEATG